MTKLRVREAIPALVVLAVVALTACNDNHVVAGARCSSGATDAAPYIHTRAPLNAAPVDHIASASTAYPDAVPASATSLLDAMDVTSALSLESQAATSVSLSSVARQAAAFNGLGALQPLAGPSFAWISTGVAGAGTVKTLASGAVTQDFSSDDVGGAACGGVADSYDCATLSFTFVAPADAQGFSFDFDFMSAEYPEYVGSDFNDTFVVSLSSSNPAHNFANIVYDGNNHPITINNNYFHQPCGQLSGTGFSITDFFGNCDAGGTGLLTTSAPLTAGETITLQFRIYDSYDHYYDSAVMIDNFRFGAAPVGTPTTGTPTPTPGVSPTPTPLPTVTPAESPTPTPSPASSPTPEPTPACSN